MKATYPNSRIPRILQYFRSYGQKSEGRYLTFSFASKLVHGTQRAKRLAKGLKNRKYHSTLYSVPFNNYYYRVNHAFTLCFYMLTEFYAWIKTRLWKEPGFSTRNIPIVIGYKNFMTNFYESLTITNS